MTLRLRRQRRMPCLKGNPAWKGKCLLAPWRVLTPNWYVTSAKEYVPKAAGLASGVEGPDAARLQRYLQKFGYIQALHLSSFGAAADA